MKRWRKAFCHILNWQSDEPGNWPKLCTQQYRVRQNKVAILTSMCGNAKQDDSCGDIFNNTALDLDLEHGLDYCLLLVIINYMNHKIVLTLIVSMRSRERKKDS